MALLFIGNRGALCYKEKIMSEKEVVEEEERIREYEKKGSKYKQLEFEFEDPVAPI